jgi:hypothetical protein
MPDDRQWTWYAGILAGYGECIWQQTVHEQTTLRYISRILHSPRGPSLMAVPFGAAKGAEVHTDGTKILMYAAAEESAVHQALELHGVQNIIRATPADIDKAPKLRLV